MRSQILSNSERLTESGSTVVTRYVLLGTSARAGIVSLPAWVGTPRSRLIATVHMVCQYGVDCSRLEDDSN